ncbi:MAG: hypothetical protein ACLSA6_03710 [Holdemania massiliensis]
MNEALRSAGLTCLKLLNDAGYEAWWVGGCVRDGLLGRPVQDIDITTQRFRNKRWNAFKVRVTRNSDRDKAWHSHRNDAEFPD